MKTISIANFDHGRYLTPEDHKKLSRIPGSADWIRAKENKKKEIYKKASEREDPYKSTKAVALAGAIGIPSDAIFDLSNLAVDTYRQNKGKYGSKTGKVMRFLKSPEFKETWNTFKRQQKGYAIPASVALSSIPIAITFAADRRRAKKMSKTASSDLAEKLATHIADVVGVDKIAKAKSEFQKLKDRKVPLTPEERKKCMDEKAVWNFTGGPTPAVWKSVGEDGKATYITNTHRAWQKAPSLKGAIGKYHRFIKGTA